MIILVLYQNQANAYTCYILVLREIIEEIVKQFAGVMWSLITGVFCFPAGLHYQVNNNSYNNYEQCNKWY
ncbi:hypothetical protein ABIE50_005374 [Chitinophaga sp. OAE865]